MFKTICRRAARQLIPSRAALPHNVRLPALHSRSYAAAASASFDWRDPLGLQSLLTEEELGIQETAESYCQEKLLPRVLGSSA
jgi:glutaryl-CoA dehydrogenase